MADIFVLYSLFFNINFKYITVLKAFQCNCQPTMSETNNKFKLSVLLEKQGQLMEKAVAFSCPSLPCNSGLVRNATQEYIQMVLEVVNVLGVHGSNILW